MKVLSVYIYRNYLTDSSANGFSSNRTQAYLYGDNVEGSFKIEPDETLRLKKRDTGYVYAEPFVISEEQKKLNGPMFGGNFIYTSDSRFPSKQPIPIHDRFEQWN